MKQVRLLLSFFSEMTFPAIVVCAVMTAAMLVMTFVTGEYQFIMGNLDYYKASSLQNAVYYTIDEPQTEDPFADIAITETVIETIRQFDCVASVLTDRIVSPLKYNNDEERMFLHLYSEDVLDTFPVYQHLDACHAADMDVETGTETAVLVIGSQPFGDIAVGDTLPLYLLRGETRIPFEVRVTGISYQPHITPCFSGGGTYPIVNDFLNEGTTLIARETPELLAFFKENCYPFLYPEVFVDFKPGIDNTECLAYMAQNGTYAHYAEIIQNTQEEVDYLLKSQMPLPLFFLFIASMALFSVAVLFLFKKMRQYSIYYICGCSRRRCNRLIIASLGLLTVIALLLNIAIIAVVPTLRIHGIIELDNILLDWRNYMYVTAYAVFTLMLIFITQHIVVGRDTPMTAVRRFE